MARITGRTPTGRAVTASLSLEARRVDTEFGEAQPKARRVDTEFGEAQPKARRVDTEFGEAQPKASRADI